MLKTILATAAAALITVTFGASAYAGGPTNGSVGSNGTSLNGLSINGMGLNGMSINGMGINGLGINGITANALGSNALHVNGMAPASSSFAIDGIELPAQLR
ncbi:MAG: hypothetical protein J0H77_34705 [Alphaproteobacteria bacterium]|jgi:hypothetical protein|nr:hypothetical protein [Alphaproteobacteria bacterium]